MFNVVLVEPEIPPNTGNVGRLCLATRSTLHLVKPFGFSLDDRQLRRAGLDYWGEVQLQLWDSFDALQQAQSAGTRYFFLTTKAQRPYYNTNFRMVISSSSAAKRKDCRISYSRPTLTIASPSRCMGLAV
jgi:tRNA (cytidine/uridine-2'-O-)-methyltransferase